MEPLDKRLDRLVSECDKIIEIYDFAESLYPYDLIKGDFSLNEHKQRQRESYFQSFASNY